MPITQWAVLVVVMVVLIVAWYLVRRWLRNLRKLTDAILELQQIFATGNVPASNLWVGSQLDIAWHVAALQGLALHYTDNLQNLWQADAVRQRILASLTQDLRTPLTTFQGYLETMQLKAGSLSAEQHERYLAIAIKNCYRLHKLVDEFHELSKLDCIETRPNMTLFSLTELVQHVLQKYALAAQEREIILGITGHSLRHVIAADMGMIERVITNLIDNALRFTTRGGEVRVKLREYRTKVKVQIIDTGKGMRQEEVLQLFNGAIRVGSFDDTIEKPTGVGLLIVKRILDLHGCEINIDSEVGIGTTFYFDLPLAQAHAGE